MAKLQRTAHAAVRHLTALQGAQTGEQHRGLDRFDHVVVGTGFQAEDVIEVVFLGSEDDDGRVGYAADFAAHMQAALARQHQVEHDDFRFELKESGHRQVATVHLADLKAVLGQEMRNQPGELLVIFHQQYFAKTQVIHNDRLPTLE